MTDFAIKASGSTKTYQTELQTLQELLQAHVQVENKLGMLQNRRDDLQMQRGGGYRPRTPQDAVIGNQIAELDTQIDDLRTVETKLRSHIEAAKAPVEKQVGVLRSQVDKLFKRETAAKTQPEKAKLRAQAIEVMKTADRMISQGQLDPPHWAPPWMLPVTQQRPSWR
jgi:hypothetical protein